MVNESDELFNKQNTKQDENWRKYCEKILKCGIGVSVHRNISKQNYKKNKNSNKKRSPPRRNQALNLRELSELHQLVYLAGLRYTHEIRRRRAAYCGVRLKEKRNFYERKELEHQQKGTSHQYRQRATQLQNSRR